jgi:hypothetical protein
LTTFFKEVVMRRYTLISGAFFSILALVQLTRALLAWPLQIASVNVPLWPSWLAFLIAGSFAVWAFRSAGRASATP